MAEEEGMTIVEAPRLEPEQARFRSDVRALGIRSTAELEPSSALGDPRGLRALELALNMRGPGYHVFVCGVEGPERLERIAAIARPLVRRDAPLSDWVYVHCFSNPNRPRAIQLPAGDGRRLQTELATFIRNLREDLPKAFREEAFDEEKRRIVEAFQEQNRAEQRHLQELAEQAGFTIILGPGGNVALIPLVDGKPIESEEQFRALGEKRIAELEKARQGLERDLREHLERHRDARHKLDAEIRSIEREFAARIVNMRIAALSAGFESPVLQHQLRELVDYLLDNLDPFRGEPQAQTLPFPFATPETQEPFAVYEVNVVVDNSVTKTAPVIVVDSPTYKNLFGTIDRTVDRLGRLSTDFRRIHAGAMLEADGGVLVVSAEDALVEPFVWRILRRSLRSGRVEIEAYDPFVLFTPAGVRPEPIRVETKVVLLGPRWLFEMLLRLDDEFPVLFKVLADFSPVVDRDAETTRALCGRLAGAAREEDLLPLEASALDALVELAVREAGDRRKLCLGSESVLDLAREADARARAAGHSKIVREDVLGALRDRIHRLDRIEEALRDAIARGVLLVDVEGERVGQVNALAVWELGGHAFGRPARVTATVGLGAEGVVSIDRETELSGKVHDKGVLILEGLLRNRFARDRPLSLVASVVFEQSYASIEGDSASLAELIAILSRLGGFPIRQDRAVTGSVNQAGDVQAVGGVNEKIEGFFDCCRVKGLTGQQGVVLPEANVEHLALRDDVVEALEAGEFHLFPVHSVDEALVALTGRKAGDPREPGTLNFEVDCALEELARKMKEFARR
jgi:ATP-dependent Lon protease